MVYKFNEPPDNDWSLERLIKDRQSEEGSYLQEKKPVIKTRVLKKHNWFVCLFSKKKREERKRWEARWGKHLTEAQEIEIIPMKYEPHEPFYLDYTYKNKENNMSKWITDRRPTEEDADCTGFVWITTDYGGVLREQWKTVRDRPWMPITPPEPYVEPPKRYKLMYRSTTRQYYIQDTESCDKRFVASCIPTREKAARISNIFEEQNSMSEWITDRKPIEHDESYVYDSFGHVCHWIKIANGEPWKPIPKCEPYVKPKRFVVKRMMDIYSDIESCGYCVYNNIGGVFAKDIPTRKAAERIAAIYEETMP